MAGNSFGTLFKITTFGESHGPAIGVVIDGCPAGLNFDLNHVQAALDRRKPGQSALTTARSESDKVEAISGIFEEKTTGAPICLMIKNQDQRSGDYDQLKDVFRPSHADYTWQMKYGHRDYRGGGRSSARETAARVAAGAVADIFLREMGISVIAYVSKVHTIRLDESMVDLSLIETNPVRCPNEATAKQMEAAILAAKEAGDSLGGVVSCRAEGLPVGLGEPVFDRFEAELAKAMLSINATKGFEIGDGFEMTNFKGSEVNDAFVSDGNQITTSTNHSGGTQGGVTNGMPLFFKVAFKPTATINHPQTTVDKAGQPVTLQAKGRHDPCVLPRAVPIVEAMAKLVIADFVLRNRAVKL